MKLLLSRGADYREKDNEGQTALHLITRHKLPKCMGILLRQLLPGEIDDQDNSKVQSLYHQSSDFIIGKFFSIDRVEWPAWGQHLVASGQGEHPAFGLVTELAHPFLFYYFVLSYQLFHLYSFPKNSFFFYTAVLSFLFSVYTDLSPVFFFSIISSFPLFFFCVALFTPPGFNMQSDL